MEHYAGIYVSLELSSVCVVDAQGKIVRETKVASEPEALVAFFASLGFAVKRIGLEAGPLSAWLHAGAEASRISYCSAGDATCEGGVIGNDGEDRPQGCARACPADPDGLGSVRCTPKRMGSQEVRALLVARSGSRAAYRRRIEHSCKFCAALV